MGTDNTLLAFAALGFLLFAATCIFIVYEFRKAFSSLEQDIALLDVKVNFLFQQENKRFLESIGKTPKHHQTAPDSTYTKKVLSGEIDPQKVSLLDFYKNAGFVPLPEVNPPRFDKSFFEKGEDQVIPGAPPEDTILVGKEFRKRFSKNRATGNPNLPKMKNPPPPPPLKPKKPTK